MTPHTYRTGAPQCTCRWCGKRPFREDCVVTLRLRVALATFAADNGRSWKRKLLHSWLAGCVDLPDDVRQQLMELRNLIGPHGLHRVAPSMLDDAIDRFKFSLGEARP